MENFERKFFFPEIKNEQVTKVQKFLIPEKEISEFFSRSSGKGGQNVNKVASKSGVRWNVNQTTAFTEDEKARIQKNLGNRITKDGDLIVTCQQERSQLQNRQRAMEKLNKLIEEALTPEKERVPTKPTRSSKERRLEEKRRLGEKKKWRREKF